MTNLGSTMSCALCSHYQSVDYIIYKS